MYTSVKSYAIGLRRPIRRASRYRGRSAAPDKSTVLEQLAARPRGDIALSVATVAELLFGERRAYKAASGACPDG